jgi:RNA polymerase primary sigma factor
MTTKTSVRTAALSKDRAATARVAKAKASPAARKALSAAIEVEPDIEIDVDAEITTSAKVKPLRVKVPKSKARALIREFGLDVTTLSDEEIEKRRSELTALIKMGKRC